MACLLDERWKTHRHAIRVNLLIVAYLLRRGFLCLSTQLCSANNVRLYLPLPTGISWSVHTCRAQSARFTL